MSLPIHPSQKQASQACAYCAKLCRPSCPVSNVTGNDADSAWGLMNTIHRAESSDSVAVQDAFACSGCMGCESHCELGTPVTQSIRAVRAQAFAANNLPNAAEEFADELAKRAVKLRAASLTLHTAKRVATVGTVVLFPGCSTTVKEPERIGRVQTVLSKLLQTEVVVYANECCGLPELELGDSDGFAGRSKAIHAAFSQAKLVVTLDPGCAHAMRELAATKVAMKTLVELAVEQGWLTDQAHPPLANVLHDFAWHDPCRMRRGLGLTQQPRETLKLLTGEQPKEVSVRESDSLCSGGGGLLPRTHPEIASKMADEMNTRLALSGAQQVVTGCPTAKARFEKVGIRVSLLDDWILAGLEKQSLGSKG